jgi:hypothetical protein
MTTSNDTPPAHAPTLLWTPELAAEANTARELFPSFFDCDPDPPGETHTAFAQLRAAFAGLPREYLERGLVRPGLTRAKDELVQRLIRVYGDGDDVAISGIDASSLADSDPTQDLGLVEFGRGDPSWGFQQPIPLASIDPIVLSEVVRDLESLGQVEQTR